MAETMTTEAAADSLMSWEAACERLHQMGHDVSRGKIPFFDQRDWESEDVMNVWAGKYTRNIALHYRDILSTPHIGPLQQVLGGKHPVAVVGAGPSLDKNVESLRDFPGLIVATDRAARALTARAIPVDLVVCVDPRLVVMAEMLNYRQNREQTLVLSVCCSPEVADVWKGRKLYFSTIHEGTQFHDRVLPELFPGMPALFATGNVGNTAVQLAAYMAASKVVLVGQDYGYTGNRMHCDDFSECTISDLNGEQTAWARVPCEPNSPALQLRSGKVEVDGISTYNAFIEYRKSLHLIVDVNGIDLVNATEGGILTDFPCSGLAAAIAELRSKGHEAGGARALLAKALEGVHP